MSMRWQYVPEPEREIVARLLGDLSELGFGAFQYGIKGASEDGVRYFETTGPAGWIRGEGSSMQDAVMVAFEKARKRLSCSHSNWLYTHRENGHKTCAHCGILAPCTPEEAMAQYSFGEVKHEGGHLRFDHRKPLCACGSHTLKFDPVFHVYRCPQCSQRQVRRERDGYPVFDGDGVAVLDPVDHDPIIAGLYDTTAGAWVMENGRPVTYPLHFLIRWRYLLAAQAQGARVFRIYLPDGTPSDVIGLDVEEGALMAAIASTCRRIAGEPPAPDNPA